MIQYDSGMQNVICNMQRRGTVELWNCETVKLWNCEIVELWNICWIPILDILQLFEAFISGNSLSFGYKCFLFFIYVQYMLK